MMRYGTRSERRAEMNKFRVWDNLKAGYANDDDFLIDSEGYLWIIDYFDECSQPAIVESDKRRFVLEFFTGLTDRNGTEIFENDIVEWCDSDHQIRIDAVRRVNSAFVLCNDNHHIGCYQYQIRRVLGTTHQNPELLEGDRHGEGN